PSLPYPTLFRSRRVEARGQPARDEAREHDSEVVEEPVVERQRARVVRQRAAAVDCVDDVAHRAHLVALRDVIELPLERLDGQPLDPRVAAVREVADVVVHHDRERAHRVNAATKEELHMRLAGAVSSASYTDASRL